MLATIVRRALQSSSSVQWACIRTKQELLLVKTVLGGSTVSLKEWARLSPVSLGITVPKVRRSRRPVHEALIPPTLVTYPRTTVCSARWVLIVRLQVSHQLIAAATLGTSAWRGLPQPRLMPKTTLTRIRWMGSVRRATTVIKELAFRSSASARSITRR